MTLKLTQEQKDFIHEVKTSTRHLHLEAVAGSGKTTTLVEAIRQLPQDANALSLAFNKKNAEELKERLPDHIKTMTLNALGHRALSKQSKKRINVDGRKLSYLTSEYIKANKEANPALTSAWGAIRELASKCKAEGLAPVKMLNEDIQSTLPDVPESYEDVANKYNIDASYEVILAVREILTKSIQQWQQGKIDFDDQLYIPFIYSYSLPLYDTVFVDEAQDLSILQHHLIKSAMHDDSRLIIIGDSRQAIYGFRGADANSMLKLSEEFNMHKMHLTYSFRCASKIIAEAQRIVPEIQAMPDAPPGEVSYIAAKDWAAEDLEQHSAVVCRNIAPLVVLAFRLIKKQIGAHLVGGDLGAGLRPVAKQFTAKTQEELDEQIHAWRVDKMDTAKANNNHVEMMRVDNIAEALHACVVHGEASSGRELVEAIDALCNSTGSIALSTIHRAKGREWDTVYWLAPERCPSFYAEQASETNPDTCGWMMEQEQNLMYIATTRAKRKLIKLEEQRNTKRN